MSSLYKIGVHCSVRNGFVAALEETQRLGCRTLQMFTQSPRGWRTRVYTESEFAAFRRKRAEAKIGPVVVHAPYLPNLCTSDEALYKRSVRALRDDLARCAALDADYLVIHPGAYSDGATPEKGFDQLSKAIDLALSEAGGKTRLLIENMAGGGRRLGATFQEIREVFRRVRQVQRLGICFDTCHALAAGYALSEPQAVDAIWREFDEEIGLDQICVFHVNDSRTPRGSHRDMHQHVGRGFIGLAAFRSIFKRPQFSDCAFILETPKDSPHADSDNLARLRACLPKA